MKIKKLLLVLFAVLAICLTFAGCTNNNPPNNNPTDTGNTDNTGGGSTEIVNKDLTFDFNTKTVTLNNGIKMPILGIGTFQLSNNQAENSVYWALRDGYRLIDTARIYGNEEGVGRGIRRAISEGLVTREEVFVTTKM